MIYNMSKYCLFLFNWEVDPVDSIIPHKQRYALDMGIVELSVKSAVFLP